MRGQLAQSVAIAERFLLKMQKSDDHIRHLHAGVVDVVLHIHSLARGAQQAHKRVAQDGVAQMPDVRGLVGIDAGVLDQNFARRDVSPCGSLIGDTARRPARRDSTRALMYPAPGDFELLEALDRRRCRDNLFGDFARRLAKFLRQFKCERQRELAQLHFRRLLDHDFRRSRS